MNSPASYEQSPRDRGLENKASETLSAPTQTRISTPVAEKDTPQSQITAVPYSIYTPKEKWFIVGLSAFAGLFSGLTSNIYFPAIPVIANAFNKSTELINLTVTVYLVLQGISPMIWGTLSDRYGRRPVFLACLLVLAVSCVGLALVPTSAYWLLMLLRCLQAAGGASTIALGAGVIGDIATRAERGGFFGLYTVGPLIGPAIGPVMGGALSDSFGWRSIFWFMCIASSCYFVILLLLLPETLRLLVGDGSYLPGKLHRPVIPILGRGRISSEPAKRPPPPGLPNPLRILMYPDVMAQLIFNGINYAVFSAVVATIPSLFKVSYPYLSETKIGLCYMSIGGGMMLGSFLHGKVLDWDYQNTKRQFARRGSTTGRCIKGRAVPHRTS
ncbi:hypothetical protein HGRIS_004766 [Hohenbuehelia grisea]|uniref:Major facilitator superfamily (MFS) profile domain-containing protein n=1 Tax=Hohenbuehelia grisea TaxID=104357 RepID=A0ABR3JD37_9AGAR